MGIFRHGLTWPEHASGTGWDDQPGVSVDLWVSCDRCCVAEAQVQVVTDAGSVFLCQHHYREHCHAIVTAGHLTRARRPGSGSCG
jgi:hypothetical protein